MRTRMPKIWFVLLLALIVYVMCLCVSPLSGEETDICKSVSGRVCMSKRSSVLKKLAKYFPQDNDYCFDHIWSYKFKAKYCIIRRRRRRLSIAKCSTSASCVSPISKPPTTTKQTTTKPTTTKPTTTVTKKSPTTTTLPSANQCVADKDQYCSPLATKINTRCMYCGIDERNCGSVIKGRIPNSEQQEAILSYHNSLRSKIAKGEVEGQPGAADMNELAWDDQLAISAQLLADQCINGHDKNRTVIGMSSVGQNLAQSWTSSAKKAMNFEDRIDQWFDEVKDFPSVNVGQVGKKATTEVTGHYTQVVWAKTEKIGCGYISYIDNRPSAASYKYTHKLICNYWPAGNVFLKTSNGRIGRPVYTASTKSDQPGALCAGGEAINGLCPVIP